MLALRTLVTDRLLLRPFELRDAPRVRELASERDIALTTLSMPHPYPDGAAEAFIIGTQEGWEKGNGATFAIVHKTEASVIGAIGISLTLPHRRGEMGYWLGRPYWGAGYTTEAARRVVHYAFEDLGLNRIFAMCFPHNIGSSRVMEKAGMTYEGTMRQHFIRFDHYEDAAIYAILRRDWLLTRQQDGRHTP